MTHLESISYCDTRTLVGNRLAKHFKFYSAFETALTSLVSLLNHTHFEDKNWVCLAFSALIPNTESGRAYVLRNEKTQTGGSILKQVRG